MKGSKMKAFNYFYFISIMIVVALFSSIFAAIDPPYEVGTWANFCEAAVSHTFDDNTTGQTTVAQPLFNEKGFHMTLFTVTGSMNPNWTNLKEAFKNGHEIGSHSVTHAQTMPDAECPTSQKTIREKVPGEMCITIAYPNCNIPNPQTELKQCYIAGRVCDGQIVNKTPTDFYRIGAIMAGSAGINTADGFNSKTNEAVSKKGWLVWCHHGVGNDNHGYSNTNVDALKGNLNYLDQNRHKVWTESFGNVARYIKEREAVSIKQKDSSENSFTISVTDNLPDSIYNYPLSIRRPIPAGWTKVVVKQDGVAMKDTIVTVNNKNYIMFRAVPDKGDVVISKDGESSLRNRLTNNSLLKSTFKWNGNYLNIECNMDAVIKIFDCQGKFIGLYNLVAGNSKIYIESNISKALILKITSKNFSYHKVVVPQL